MAMQTNGQIEACRAIYRSATMTERDKLAWIGKELGLVDTTATASTTRPRKTASTASTRRSRPTAPAKTTNRTRRPRSGGGSELQQLVEAAARQHRGTFTPAQLIADYPALKNQRPNIIGRALGSIPGATKGTKGLWSYTAPAQREAA